MDMKIFVDTDSDIRLARRLVFYISDLSKNRIRNKIKGDGLRMWEQVSSCHQQMFYCLIKWNYTL